jgi:hypothetical protein
MPTSDWQIWIAAEAKVNEIAERVGPSIDWITGGADIDPNLIAHFGDRSGCLKPADGRTRLDEIDELPRPDLQRHTSSRG